MLEESEEEEVEEEKEEEAAVVQAEDDGIRGEEEEGEGGQEQGDVGSIDLWASQLFLEKSSAALKNVFKTPVGTRASFSALGVTCSLDNRPGELRSRTRCLVMT